MISISSRLRPARFIPSRVSPIRRSATCPQNWSTNISDASLPPVASCSRYETNSTQTASPTEQTLWVTVWSGDKLWSRFLLLCVGSVRPSRWFLWLTPTTPTAGRSTTSSCTEWRTKSSPPNIRLPAAFYRFHTDVTLAGDRRPTDEIFRLTYVHVFTFVVASDDRDAFMCRE